MLYTRRAIERDDKLNCYKKQLKLKNEMNYHFIPTEIIEGFLTNDAWSEIEVCEKIITGDWGTYVPQSDGHKYIQRVELYTETKRCTTTLTLDHHSNRTVFLVVYDKVLKINRVYESYRIDIPCQKSKKP